MRAMRTLLQESGRDKLVVRLSTRSEVKKWGDWEIEYDCNEYQKGWKKDTSRLYAPGGNCLMSMSTGRWRGLSEAGQAIGRSR